MLWQQKKWKNFMVHTNESFENVIRNETKMLFILFMTYSCSRMWYYWFWIVNIFRIINEIWQQTGEKFSFVIKSRKNFPNGLYFFQHMLRFDDNGNDSMKILLEKLRIYIFKLRIYISTSVIVKSQENSQFFKLFHFTSLLHWKHIFVKRNSYWVTKSFIL